MSISNDIVGSGALSRLALVLGLSVLAAACGGTLRPLGPPTSMMISEPMADDEIVRAAIGRALERNRYQVESVEPGSIVAINTSRGRLLRVLITYDRTSYQIALVESAGFGEGTDPVTGQRMILSSYYGALNRLDRWISVSVRRLVRDSVNAEVRVARANAPQVQVVGTVGGSYQAQGVAPAYGYGGQYMTCESELQATGHSQSSEIFCDEEVDLPCASTLLRAGHSPTNLMFCKRVDSACAVNHLQGGGSPTALNQCAYR